MLLFGVGLIGASVISLVVDRTRQFEVAAKVCFAVAGCMLISFMVVSIDYGIINGSYSLLRYAIYIFLANPQCSLIPFHASLKYKNIVAFCTACICSKLLIET